MIINTAVGTIAAWIGWITIIKGFIISLYNKQKL